MGGDIIVINRGLKNRTAFSNSLNNELSTKFNELAEETRISKSKLLDEAIEDLLKKHGKLEKQ